MSTIRLPAVLALAATLLTASACAQSGAAPQVRFTPFVSGLSQVTTLTHAGDGSGRMYATEQGASCG